MKALRWIVVGIACCFAISLVAMLGSGGSAPSSAVVVSSGTAPSAAESSDLGGRPLVLPATQFLVGDDLSNAQRETDRANPVAAREREVSDTRFERMDTAQASSLARTVFPAVVDKQAGGLPALQKGERITHYATDYSAQLELPDGRRAVMESLTPIAAETPSGAHVPIDLTLRQEGAVFRPRTSAVDVQIPTRLADGISLPDIGVSLEPIRADGKAAEGSEGRIDGDAVFYGNTETAADTLVRPTGRGVEEDTILRSVESPEQLEYRIDMPEGSRAVELGKSDAVHIMAAGNAIATILPPTANDAEGTPVPVTMSVTGNILKLVVSHNTSEAPGGYRYPIDVDPTVEDTHISVGTTKNNWATVTTSSAFHFEYSPHEASIYSESGTFKAEDLASYIYNTQKESHINQFFVRIMGSREGIKVVPEVIIRSPLAGVENAAAFGGAGGEIDMHTEHTGVTSTDQENAAYFSTFAAEAGVGTFFYNMTLGDVTIDQAKGPTASIDVVDTTLNGNPNAGAIKWASTASTTKDILGVNSFDPGIGVNAVGLKSPNKTTWGYSPTANVEDECSSAFTGYPEVECNECHENECTVTKAHAKPFSLPLASLGELPEGEDTVEATVKDAVGYSAVAKATIKVDNAAPHNVVLSNLPLEIASGEYHLKAEATDGSGAESSGMKSIALFIDGKEVGSPSGSCQPGPCTVNNAEWTIAGRNYAAGNHVATVVATDNAGNVTSIEQSFKVNAAGPVAVGPGSVNLASGEFNLNATDVSMGWGLTVGRVYGSRHLNAGGSSGAFGPSWALTLGEHETLVQQPNESVVLTTGAGAETIFTKKGSTYESAPGNQNIKLFAIEKEGGKEYILKDEATATSTTFARLNPAVEIWVPTIQKGPVATDTVTYSYTSTTVGIPKPKEALAAVPVGVSCSPEMKPGCRSLTFVYGENSPAGENKGEWGEYYGRLKEVIFTAYDPVAKVMKKTAVAKYAYDKQGRLRAEWDPRTPVKPLETIYGYDSEGHVTALTPPGKESWAFIYGSVAGDVSSGRLLKATLAPASAGLWAGSPPVNTFIPKISGKSDIGSRLAVSEGTWSGSPVAYGYRWEDCNFYGLECVPITGASNANYTVTSSDLGHTLVARVTAINGGGAVTAASVAVTTGVQYLNQFGSSGTNVGQFKSPWGLAVDGSGNIWVSDTGNTRVQEFTSSGTALRQFGTLGTGNGQFKSPEAIATDSKGDAWVADTGNNRMQEFSAEGAFIRAVGSLGTGNGQFNHPEGLSFDGKGNLWIADSINNRVEEFNEKGEYLKSIGGTSGSGNGQLKEPSDVVVDPSGNVWVDDEGNSRLEEFNEKGEYVSQCGSSGTRSGQFKLAWRMTYGAEGRIWVADSGNNRVEAFTISPTSCSFSEQFGSSGTGAGQFTGVGGVGIHGASMYALDHTNCRVETWTLPSGAEGEHRQAEPGYTVEYNVPLSGEGLPSMTEGEVKKWAQSTPPVEATAIFPPDKSQEWPATNYKRATIYYQDNKGHTVNVLNTNGGISATEYNATNNPVWNLSADNREAALKEGAKSAEAAKLLDTESTYNSEGTELESTLGPRHLVKLSNGKEVQARSHTVYSYDEGQPAEGGPYRLVTKVTEGAQVEGESEQDIRTTTTSYSGQGNLGWRLRQPTSTTVDPAGLHITHTAVYDEITGNTLETTMPVGAVENAPPAYDLQWGSSGKENGKFEHPMQTAIDASGNVWVVDGYNNRVQKFSSSGSFLATYGKEGTSKTEVQFKEPVGIGVNTTTGNIYVSDQNNNRVVEMSSSGSLVRVFGQLGAGNGEFKDPSGVAVDSKGNVWVTDFLNNRVQEFNESGTYLSQFGSAGKEKGQFNGASGVAVSGENIFVSDLSNSRIEEFNEAGKKFLREWGSSGTGNGQFKFPSGIAVAPNGNVNVADSGNQRIQEFSSTGTFLLTFGASGSGLGQFTEPEGIAITSAGTVYVTDAGTNNRVTEFLSNSGGPHTAQTVYYSAGENAKYAKCGNHPEWVNMPCLTKPAKQPETAGLPGLPETTYTYNVWGEVETATSTSGSATQTTTFAYDAAGRPSSTAISSTVGTSLPTVSYKYNESLGLVSEQSTTVEGKTQSIKSLYNKIGQLTSYTEANGTTSTYEYENGVDARLKNVYDGKGTQSYTYDENTGEAISLKDTAATGFTLTATYDAGGNMLTESYPNGMTATYGYNQTGALVSIEYRKTTHCTEKCIWFEDKIVPTIHGQSAMQISTQATNRYTYDADGRLTQVQDEPVGKGCTTRVYTYDEDTNRTSSITRPPGTGGACTTTGGTVEGHAYDQADRLLDAGTVYDAFGSITKLAAADAGGSSLESSFYVDKQLASQTQAGETIGYNLDPGDRVKETISSGKVAATVINHYDGSSQEPAWTSEPSGTTSRNIKGLNGSLIATQRNAESPVLQLANLHGDIVATASMSETATAPESTVGEASEYGVPASEAPPKYSWLGAHELPTQLPSGVVTMGVRSYVPQLGRFLQVDPIRGGSANAYAYTYGDPVGSTDLSGAYTATVSASEEEFLKGRAAEIAETRAAENAAAQAEAERLAAEESEGGEEEWEEEWEEEGEYASDHRSGSLEAGLLWQPFGEAPGEEEGSTEGTETQTRAHMCEPGQTERCARFVSKKRRKRKPKYNVCTGPRNPHDPSEACCLKNGNVIWNSWEKNPLGERCDAHRPGSQGTSSAGSRPKPLDCPDGTYPGVGYFTGEPACIPEGDRGP